MGKQALVKCPYCKEHFDRDTAEYVRVGNRYAHKSCYNNALSQKTLEEKQRTSLMNYIEELFGISYNVPLVLTQIKNYRENLNYTYQQIERCLKYAYEIKGYDIRKAKGIGIVPYVFNDAYNYYYQLWLNSQQRPGEVMLKDYTPEVVKVTIPVPVPKPFTSQKFKFLDEELEEENRGV